MGLHRNARPVIRLSISLIQYQLMELFIIRPASNAVTAMDLLWYEFLSFIFIYYFVDGIYFLLSKKI